jgi:hypothetical protein
MAARAFITETRTMNLDKLATSDKLATADKLGDLSFDENKPAPARITTRLALSGPASLAVLFLAGAVALGHTTGFLGSIPSGDTGSAMIAADDDKADEPAALDQKPDPTSKPQADTVAPKSSVADEELALAQRTPKPEPVEVIAPEPEPEPLNYVEPAPVPAPPAPPVAVLSLSANQAEYPGKVILSWTGYTGYGFEYYKVVRSTDGDATWPGSGADELIAAIGNPAETWAKDRPPCGTTVFYRVFAVRHGDYGYEVLAPSNQVSAVTQCPPPPPATVGIGLEVSVVDGAVHLSWGACASEHVNAYKIVRSQTNAEPMYPENDGTQLIAAVDPSQTSFIDSSVASGQTWFYRVLARADNGGGTYIACQSAAVSVTIP